VQNESEAAQLKLMASAPYDERFMNDLCDTMSAFVGVDAQWWERPSMTYQWHTDSHIG
jgi:hypothetical protein